MAGFVTMAVTPNYGWPVPVATDYVKDGYEAIADLGDAIDATVFGLPTGSLTFVQGGTFTTVSSFSTPSATFTATYDNYLVVIYGTGTTTTNLSIRFNSGGTPLTTNYSGGLVSATDIGTSVVLGSNAVTSLQIGYLYSSGYPDFNFSFTAYDVNNASHYPAISGTGRSSGGATSGIAGNFFGGGRIVAGAIDGITFLTSAGTITGKYKVYGYANS
jgi:hypothetical protein